MTDEELALFDEALAHVGDDDDWYESHAYLATVAPARLRALVAEVRRLREPPTLPWRRRRGDDRPEYWNEAKQRWQQEPVENAPSR